MIKRTSASKAKRFVISTAILLPQVACGTYVPQLHEAWEGADIDDNLAFRIKKSIYCELRTAVYYEGNKKVGYRGHPVAAIPDNWGAEMTITIKVDETGALNPGANLINNYRNGYLYPTSPSPLTVGRNFNLGLNGTLSSQASRTDTYYSFFNLVDMKKPFGPNETSCKVDRRGSSPLVSGNLGVHAWLQKAVETQTVIPSSPLPQSMSSKLNVLQYQVQFIVITNGALNPVYKVVDIVSNSNPLPLVSANRTRTHTLLLTMGPSTIVREPSTSSGKDGVIATAPSREVSQVHFSAQIGQAVANGIKSSLP